jgi:hypothetical protein
MSGILEQTVRRVWRDCARGDALTEEAKPMRKLLVPILVSASALALSGCASMVSGPDQSIRVGVLPEVPASCVLENASGSWDVIAPDHADITAARGRLAVRCTSIKGDMRGEASVGSRLDPVTAAGAVATGGLAVGAIAVEGPVGVGAVAIAGGAGGAALIGETEDQLSGAAWKYPLSVTVRMVPITETVGVAAGSPGLPPIRPALEPLPHAPVAAKTATLARRRHAAPTACPSAVSKGRAVASHVSG